MLQPSQAVPITSTHIMKDAKCFNNNGYPVASVQNTKQSNLSVTVKQQWESNLPGILSGCGFSGVTGSMLPVCNFCNITDHTHHCSNQHQDVSCMTLAIILQIPPVNWPECSELLKNYKPQTVLSFSRASVIVTPIFCLKDLCWNPLSPATLSWAWEEISKDPKWDL